MQALLDGGFFCGGVVATMELKCPKCNRDDFKNHKHNFSLHVAACKVRQKFMCERCKREFGNNELNFKRHVKSMKCITMNLLGVTCQMCGQQFPNKKEADEHLLVGCN